MKTTNQEIDLSILSEEAKRELIDFYSFLVDKYGRTKVKKAKKFEKLILNPLRVEKIIIPPREQLYER
jgi:hypothetical protein